MNCILAAPLALMIGVSGIAAGAARKPASSKAPARKAASRQATASAAAKVAMPPIPVRFTLTKPGYVTLVIENAAGVRVRNLISETRFAAGTHTVGWDGLDDRDRDPDAADHHVYHIPGKLVAPGTYTVRGLSRPDLHLRYQMTPYHEGNPPWRTEDKGSEWLSNHTPPISVAFIPAGGAPVREGKPSSSGGQILVGSYVSEGGSGLAWLDTDGHKLWGQGWIGGVWTGAQYLTRDEGPDPVPGVYAYTGSAWANELRLYELRQTQGKAPGDARMGYGDDQPVLTPKWEFPGSVSGAWNSSGETTAISGLAARNGLLAVSLPKLNQVLFVDGKGRKALGRFALEDPRGLAFDSQGRLLALSGRRLLRYTLPADLPAALTPDEYLGEPLSRAALTLTASANPEAARLAADGDYSTSWETRLPQTPGMSLTLDLGVERTFSALTMNNTGSDDFPRGYSIALSADGETYGAPVAEGKGSGSTTVVTLPRQAALFVKITLTASADAHWRINELTLYDRDPNRRDPEPKPFTTPQVLASDLDDPFTLIASRAGELFVSDRGKTNAVRVFSAEGKPLRTIGTPGVPKAGPYDPTRMNHPAGMTLDGQGRLWVAEEYYQPKRVSIWKPDTGQFLRAFYGPQRYGGGGEPDPRDPTFFYYDGMKLKLNLATGKSWPVAVLFNNESGRETDYPPQTSVYLAGRQYMTNAYNSSPTNGASFAQLWRVDEAKQVAIPVALAGSAITHPLLKGLVRSSENFSARWTGQVKAPASGRYTFFLEGAGEGRLWVDGQPIAQFPGGEAQGAATLEAGKRYDLRVDYRNPGGPASLRLLWEGPNTPKALVPAAALYADNKAATSSGGLSGQYWEMRDWWDYSGYPALATEGPLDFDWANAPPAAFGTPPGDLAAWRKRLPSPAEWKRGDPLAFIWSDANDNAAMEPDEVTFTPGAPGGVTLMRDLSWVFARLNEKAVRLAPTGFTAQGAPHYDLAHPQVLVNGAQDSPTSGGDQAFAAKGGWSVHTNAPKPFSRYGFGGAKNGVPMWDYPSLWPGLHASHTAPLPEFPGEVIGSTRLLGLPVTPKAGEAGELWAINGNKGTIYLLTTDGLFVATLLHDSRTASWSFKEATRGMLVDAGSAGEESFWPSLAQTTAGDLILTVNGSLLRLDGLEGVRRIPAQPLKVTAPMLRAAQEATRAREITRQAQAKTEATLTVALRDSAPTVDGKLDDWKAAQWVTVDARRTQQGDWGSAENLTQAALAVAGDRLYAAFRADDPNLLRAQPEALQNLFKAGGALDLHIGTDPKADPKRAAPVAGDVRLLVTRVGEKTTAVLYRPVAPGVTGEKVVFSSPLRTLRFDEVRDVSADVTLASDGMNYEFSVPLKTLGLAPKARLTLRGDLGLLRGNGFQTLQRVYWRNKATGLVSDIPSEAELTPRLWGDLTFQPETSR